MLVYWSLPPSKDLHLSFGALSVVGCRISQVSDIGRFDSFFGFERLLGDLPEALKLRIRLRVVIFPPLHTSVPLTEQSMISSTFYSQFIENPTWQFYAAVSLSLHVGARLSCIERSVCIFGPDYD